MKERIAGKIGNFNNNAFKLRKLFATYDTDKTGLVISPCILLSCGSLNGLLRLAWCTLVKTPAVDAGLLLVSQNHRSSHQG